MSHVKATILCLSDRRADLISRKALLERNGYRVLEATSGPEALYFLASYAIDAAILDCQASPWHVNAVASRMKRLNALAPIVLLSDFELPPDTTVVAFDAVLFKSQPPHSLVSAVEKLLAGPRKPFFYRWLDSWKVRNLGARQ